MNKEVRLTFFHTGYCVHPEKIAIQDGQWKKVKFPALVGLIEHPEKGYILYDTGYSEHFFHATRHFPYSIYRKVTPVFFQKGESIKEQLMEQGIQPNEIRYILITHFHGDHIGGLLDFPDATFICFQEAYEFIKYKKGFAAVKNGYLPDLMPDDFHERVKFVNDQKRIILSSEYAPFTEAWDIFRDGSLLAVDLTGHAIGQMGIFLRDEEKGKIFLCADACWQSRAYRENILPSRLANVIMADAKQYRKNLKRLHEFHLNHPEWWIVPTHCTEPWR